MGSSSRKWTPIERLVAGAALVTALFAAPLEAQFGQRGFGRGFGNLRKAAAADFDGTFQFCRSYFTSDPRGDGGTWTADFPRSDINLSVRLSELTLTKIGRGSDDTPTHLLIGPGDPEIFGCPFVMMTEVGRASLDAAEAANLRRYLEKGGFLWVDDFWGTYAWQSWEQQLRKVLPAADFPIVDLSPEHPLYHGVFEVQATPQIPNLGFWRGSGGGTSERGADSATVHTRAVLDEHGRIMVLMTHNTDLGDSFEREGDDPQYFYAMSVPGYAFGVNVLVYALTH